MFVRQTETTPAVTEEDKSEDHLMTMMMLMQDKI